MEFSLRDRWALLAKPILVLVCVSLTGALAVEASATTLGVLVDVYSGNDSESAIAANLGVDLGLVTLLAKIEDPATSSGGLTIFNRVLKDGEDDEYVSGEWSYSGPETVNYFVVKAGNEYALYEYNDSIPGYMENMGLWNTSDLGDKGVSHVSAYQVTPEPSTGILIAAGLAALAASRRQRGRAGTSRPGRYRGRSWTEGDSSVAGRPARRAQQPVPGGGRQPRLGDANSRCEPVLS